MGSLFHYTKAETFVEKILPSKYLKTNSLASMNDPREMEPWAFGGKNLPLEELFHGYYSRDTHIDCQYKFGNLLKNKFQVICFSGAKKDGWNNEMMWTHYGENQAGVCLEFDEDMLLKGIESLSTSANYWIGNVNYSNSDSDVSLTWDKNISSDDNFHNIIETCKPLVLTKSSFWDKEDERRLLFLNTEETIEITISSALKAIYLGLYFPHEKYLSAIEDQLPHENIDIYDVIYQSSKYERWQREKGTTKIPISRKYNN